MAIRHGRLKASTDSAPIERVQTDFTSPLPTTPRGHEHILMRVDQFTKWVECVPLPSHTAVVTANSAVDHFSRGSDIRFSQRHIPLRICSLDLDNLRKLCKYRDKRGRRRKPACREAPNGKKYSPSYNIAPGAHTPVLMSSQHTGTTNDAQERIIQPMLWGLVPSWHKGTITDKGFDTNNCRAESMLTKQTYKVPLQKGRRCVVLAEGFYEWQRSKTSKQPYYIYFPQPDTKTTTSDVDTDISSNKNITVKVTDEMNNEKTISCGKKFERISGIPVMFEHISSGNKDDVSVNVDSNGEKTKTQVSMDGEDLDLEGLDAVSDLWEDWEPEDMEQDKGEQDDMDADDREVDDGSQTQLPRLLTMAGVFDVWKPPDGGEPVYSYSVITVDSSPAMAWIHHRMPAILTNDGEIQQWLDYGDVPVTKAMKLIRPVTCLQSHPVSTIVNNSRNNSPDCIKKIDPSKPKPSASSNMMMAWLTKGSKSSQQTETQPPNKKLRVS